MIDWYKKVVFENYANFKGRARRSEYWYFTLMNTLITLFLMGLFFGFMLRGHSNSYYIFFVIIFILYSLAIMIPNLAVCVRRLHDVGKSGWFYFITIIPIIGPIWLFVLFCTAGDNGQNQYGPDPKNNLEEINEIGLE